MIISQDRALIKRLIKKYAGKSSTEAMLAFVADNNGMLPVCKLIVRKNTEDDREAMGWVDEQCYNSQVDVRDFLYVVNQILSLLQPGLDNDEYYTILDLEAGASKEEIKEAFRKLSRRYHPDTALEEELNAPERFLEINKAYHALLSGEIEEQKISRPQASNSHWKTESLRPQGAVAKKKNIILLATLTLLMIVVSIFAARGYQKKAMISGLQRHHVAFVPPVFKSEKFEENVLEIKEVESAESIILAKKVESEVQVILERDSEPEVELKAEVEIVAETQEAKIILPDVSVPKKEKVKDKTQLSVKPAVPELPKVNPVPEPLPITIVQKDALRKESSPQSVTLAPQVEEIVTPSLKEIQAETQKRIESFLAAYISSYEHKDLLSFTRFFDLNAIENGKPLGAILPTYTELFQEAETISLGVSILKWQQRQHDIFLDGRFTIFITYKNANKVQGAGEISFLLADKRKQFSIKELTYHFDK